ncbi:MAG: GvpL/GvpF family gas vesicle protein [Methylococcaceae bacterium]
MLFETQSKTAIYLYGFTHYANGFTQGLPKLPVINGIDDSHAITSHTYADLTAIISAVALADFTGEVGEENLQNVAWLTPRACRHALVIEQCMREAAVYPVPFGTLFSNLIALEQEMQRRSHDVLAVLEHILGCEEWAVDASLDRKQAIEALFTQGVASGRFVLPESAGRRHLEEQKIRRQLNNELNDWLAELLNSWQTDLNAQARDFCERRLAEDKILHWAYLMPIAGVTDFQARLAELGSRYADYGFNFRITGPWAAYSFCQRTS